ncbi:MAG: hypothetical protein CO042_00480 [Parcubacteria group bacterium CG_4_9_14_0_2_um_filter_41_8]|nr:MAG: hypothetical protein COV79_04025 [Parcubacteria group bacterium CG11_big_fil_rev_8_21_14_0_20_41_14]PJC41055.1 MAG: hypothetical protein CO042_00480 [Parcubacteria group bacterium CG_4_9_14_0_2_um_filter_41_8]
MKKLQNLYQKTAVLAIIALFVQIIPVPAQSAGIISVNSQMLKDGMAWMAESIAVEPGQEFRIYLSTANSSQMGAIASGAIMKHNLPTISLLSGGTQAVAYVSGSTFYDYGSTGVWSAFSDDGTSAFDNSGLSVSADGALDPFEGVNYKYTVRVPDALPAGTILLNWSVPQLNFSLSGTPFSVTSQNNNFITIENLPSITNFGLNTTTFSTGQSIVVTAAGTAGLSPRVEIGSIATMNLTETSAGQYSGTYVLPDSIVQSGITPRLYMVNNQSKGSYLDYGSAISINTTPAPQPTPTPSPVSGGGGGGGGMKIIYSQTPSSASNDIQNKGDKIILQLASGAKAELSVTKKLDKIINASISDLTAEDLESVPMSESFGEIIANNIYSIAITDEEVFPSGVQLTLEYAQNHLGSCKANDLVMAHYQTDLSRWVVFASTANTKTRTLYSEIKNPGYYAIACFAGGEDESDGSGINEGAILGISVGAYPNGSLLRVEGSSAVWLIKDDQRHLLPSVEIFESQFNWNNVINLSSSKQLDVYTRGMDIFFAAGTLIKEVVNPSVYRVSSNGDLQPILSEAVFYSRAYQSDDIVTVAYGTLDNLARGAYIDSADKLYTGDIIKLAGDASVYYVDGSILRPIPSYDIFIKRKMKLSSIRIISQAQFAKYGIGSNLPYPDGTLVKGSRIAVYVMSDGEKRPIRSGADFEALLYYWGNVVSVADALLENIQNGALVWILE